MVARELLNPHDWNSAGGPATREILVEWTARLRAEAGDGFPEGVTAFRPEMAVQGRFGKPCPVRSAPVQRIRHADRETNYCPRCQIGGRILADRSLSRLLKDDWPRHLDELSTERALVFAARSAPPHPGHKSREQCPPDGPQTEFDSTGGCGGAAPLGSALHNAIRFNNPSRITSVWNRTAPRCAVKVKKSTYARMACVLRSTV